MVRDIVLSLELVSLILVVFLIFFRVFLREFVVGLFCCV